MNKCIIVLGVHRSGTSIVSCLLHNLGVNMGEVFMPSDDRNPTGFFEDIEFLEIHDKIIGGNWERPNISFSYYESEYKELLNKHKNKELWGIKDPKLCLFFHNFISSMKEVMPETEVVVVKVDRDIDSIANSMTNKRWTGNTKTLDSAKKITGQYLFCRSQGLKFFRGRIHQVKYEELVNAPEEEIHKLCDFLQLDYNESIVPLVNKNHHRNIKVLL